MHYLDLFRAENSRPIHTRGKIQETADGERAKRHRYADICQSQSGATHLFPRDYPNFRFPYRSGNARAYAFSEPTLISARCSLSRERGGIAAVSCRWKFTGCLPCNFPLSWWYKREQPLCRWRRSHCRSARKSSAHLRTERSLALMLLIKFKHPEILYSRIVTPLWYLIKIPSKLF